MKKITFEEATYLLEKGKKVFNKNGDMFYQFNDFGILCSYSCADGRVDSYNLSVNKYTYEFSLQEEPKPFKITETGLYKTSEHCKAFVYNIEDDYAYYVVEGRGPEFICSAKNPTKKSYGHISPLDYGAVIISKWED